MSFPWLLSMCVGFLSLSLEILWVRYVGFSAQGAAGAFAFVLMIYLLGIARGAMVGRDFCENTPKLYTMAGGALLASGLLDIVGPFVAAEKGLHFSVIFFIYLCAFLKGIAFPIAHHLGTAVGEGRVGTSISRVYFMNIVGASLGPLVTGFWLVDVISLQAAMTLMGALSCLLGAFCVARENKGALVKVAGVITAVTVAALFLPGALTSRLACYAPEKGALRHIVETRSGILHSATSKEGGGDYIFGGNVYDGRASVDLRVNSNNLERVAVLATLHPQPKRVLVIGMSTGAWTRLLTAFPGVERIDVIEINPGYLDLIADYPEISPFLKDPRVRLHIDDGRRWLRRNPAETFDLVVINMTFHWRNYSTNLLSQEFLRLVQTHMNPGAVLTYNTTHSPDVLVTAESVFPYAFGYLNFVVAGDKDFRPLRAGGEKRLWDMNLDGHAMLNQKNAADRDFVKLVLSVPFLSSKEQRPIHKRDGEIITDRNMITEYKHGRALSLFCR